MHPASALSCPGCQTPRVDGPECPRCGIIYARADARAARKAEQERAAAHASSPHDAEGASARTEPDAPSSPLERASAAAAREAWARPTSPNAPGSATGGPSASSEERSGWPPPPGTHSEPRHPRWAPDSGAPGRDSPRFDGVPTGLFDAESFALAFAPSSSAAAEHLHEVRLRMVVVPTALLLSYLGVTGSMHFVIRLVTMYVHEMGHAVTAWLCGILAIPGPWATSIGGKRLYWMAMLLAGALALWTWTGWKQRRHAWVAWGASLLVIQFVCTLVLSMDRALALISFGGDAGMLVLGTVLMGTFYVQPGSALHARGLRWGFVAIGALAFWDGFHTWWTARTDAEAIPFGRIEGVALSDASSLVETYGWSEGDLIHRHVVLGLACLTALAALHAWMLYRERAHLRAALRALPFQDG